VVFLGKPTVIEDRALKASRVRVPLHCRNATQPVTLVVRFGEPKQPEVRKSLACAPEAGPDAEVDLRAEQFTVLKLRAYVEVLRADGALRAVSPRFAVRLPKP
jgi:hypothetical protein